MWHHDTLVPPAVKKAVFLDRDGVINRSLRSEGRPVAPRRMSEFRLLPGAKEGVARLKRRGFAVVVVTNQPDVARGLISGADLAAMNKRLLDELKVDMVIVCPHLQGARCPCRKPAPGMLRRAAAELRVTLRGSYMVGDRWSDVEAGRAAGCYTVKVERHWTGERVSRPDAVVASFIAAVRHILSMEGANA